jgi:phenylalanyl-tRNA synthetase beta chain
MKFSYNFLQSFFDKKLPQPEKLGDLLTLHIFEIETIDKVRDDYVLDIDITPNRAADCLSHYGIAKEISVITELKLKEIKPRIKEVDIDKTIKIEVKDSNECPRYTSRIITDVKVGESPKYIKDRLMSCGLEPINNIVDAANYVMLEMGQPMHAFDFDKVDQIIVRKADKETIEGLDDKEYKLDSSILVIADSTKPIAIAGIKGGKNTGVSKETNTVLLEAANFDPLLIRETSRKLNLKTDASFRYEHGYDPNLTEISANRLAELIVEVAGGKVSKLIDKYPKKRIPLKIKFNENKLERLLGVKIKNPLSILKSLGMEINGDMVTVPTSRPDITSNVDLIEEIGRIHGYFNLESEFPKTYLQPVVRDEELVWINKVQDILKLAGFTETYNYSFVSKEEGGVELENAFSEDMYYLRKSLLNNLVKAAENNLKNRKEVHLFEIGKTFGKEKTMLSAIMTGKNKFYELKGVVDLVIRSMGITDYMYIDTDHKRAEIKVGSTPVGVINEVKKNMCAFEIDFKKLINLASEENEYLPISKYPSAVRDVSVLVSQNTRVADVMNEIHSHSNLIIDIDLFDIFEKEGEKSLAFHIKYQSDIKTLESSEIDLIQNNIINGLESLGFTVRK